MGKLKNFFRNINLLNITLIAAIVLLANYTVLPVFSTNIKYSLHAPKKTVADKEEKSPQSQTPSPLDYMIVAEQNLFHPERRIPEKKEGKELPKPEFVLYGTLITDEVKLAYLEDLKAPYSTPGRGKRQRPLRLGNTLSGYTLNEIHADRVVMVKGEERIEVKVLDPQYKKAHSADTAIKPGTSKVQPRP